MKERIICNECSHMMTSNDKYCLECKHPNPSFDYYKDLNQEETLQSLGPRTRYEEILARKLSESGINFKANPVISLSYCIWYTVDFLIEEKLVVEVDGGIHDSEYIQTRSRIRERALTNLGYSLLRIKNDEVTNSIHSVIEKIQAKLSNSVKDKQRHRINLLDIRRDNLKPLDKVMEENEYRIQKLVFEIDSSFEKELNKNIFEEMVKEYDISVLKDKCLIELTLLHLFGLRFNIKNDGRPDFEYYAEFFNNCLNIMKDLFGENGSKSLTNNYNITAVNNLKNIFLKRTTRILDKYTRIFLKNKALNFNPNYNNKRIKPITNYTTFIDYLNDFNKFFNPFDIYVDKDDILFECHESYKKMKYPFKEQFQWLSQ